MIEIRTVCRMGLILALGGALLAGPTACIVGEGRKERKKEKERLEESLAEEKEVGPNRRPLVAGESVTFEFDADGAWHPAPYSVRHDQVVEFLMDDETSGVGPFQVQYMIGEKRYVIGDRNNTYRVTRPGPIAFRLLPERASVLKGKCKVILNCKE